MENNTQICVDCGQEYEITEGWKKLMEQNPDIQPPKRCYDCRQKRKRENKREDEREKRW